MSEDIPIRWYSRVSGRRRASSTSMLGRRRRWSQVREIESRSTTSSSPPRRASFMSECAAAPVDTECVKSSARE